eukprot:COSAG02_NODE_5874_length_3971_cov_5.196798_2_plen_117_part_00
MAGRTSAARNITAAVQHGNATTGSAGSTQAKLKRSKRVRGEVQSYLNIVWQTRAIRARAARPATGSSTHLGVDLLLIGCEYRGNCRTAATRVHDFLCEPGVSQSAAKSENKDRKTG